MRLPKEILLEAWKITHVPFSTVILFIPSSRRQYLSNLALWWHTRNGFKITVCHTSYDSMCTVLIQVGGFQLWVFVHDWASHNFFHNGRCENVFIRHQMEENTETGLNSNKKCVVVFLLQKCFNLPVVSMTWGYARKCFMLMSWLRRHWWSWSRRWGSQLGPPAGDNGWCVHLELTQ